MDKSIPHRNRIGVAALFVVLLPGVAFADHYKVSFSTARADDDGAARLARVEAQLTPDKGRIRLTRAAEFSGLYHGWAGFLTEIEAMDRNGRPIELTYEVPGVWRLDRPSPGEITIRYALNLQHDRFPNEPGDNELAHAHAYGVMWTGRALFMEGAPSNNVTVAFDLPSGWKVSTPWHRKSEDGWVFSPKNTDALLDAAFMAGAHREFIIDLGTAQARIALGPPVQELGPVFERLIRGYFSSYTELFGEAPKENFLVIGAEASFLGGGVMGRTISLSLTEDAVGGAAQNVVAHIIAHEGFHLWNVQWGDQNLSWEELEWLKEGVAEYYTFLTSVRLGVIKEEQFLSSVSERYGTYLTALAGGKTLVSAQATKLSSHQSYNLIYNGGMMVCLLLDLRIRQVTEGRLSLDDVVRAIHEEFGAKKDMLTLAALGRLIKQKTGVDFGRVIQNNVRGRQKVQLTDVLATVGLQETVGPRDGSVVASLTKVDSPTPEQRRHYRDWVGGK